MIKPEDLISRSEVKTESVKSRLALVVKVFVGFLLGFLLLLGMRWANQILIAWYWKIFLSVAVFVISGGLVYLLTPGKKRHLVELTSNNKIPARQWSSHVLRKMIEDKDLGKGCGPEVGKKD